MSKESSYQNIYMFQGMTHAYHPNSIQQLRVLPCVVFLNAKSSQIEITEDIVRVKLYAYTGLKGFVNKFRYKNKESKFSQLLASTMTYYLVKNKDHQYPQIEIEWVS